MRVFGLFWRFFQLTCSFTLSMVALLAKGILAHVVKTLSTSLSNIQSLRGMGTFRAKIVRYFLKKGSLTEEIQEEI